MTDKPLVLVLPSVMFRNEKIRRLAEAEFPYARVIEAQLLPVEGGGMPFINCRSG